MWTSGREPLRSICEGGRDVDLEVRVGGALPHSFSCECAKCLSTWCAVSPWEGTRGSDPRLGLS